MGRKTTVAAFAVMILGAASAAGANTAVGAGAAARARTTEAAPTTEAARTTGPAGMATHVIRADHGYITTTTMPNGDTLKVYGGLAYVPGTAAMTPRAATAADGSAQTTVAGQLDPPAGADKDTVATTMVGAGDVTAEQELLALGAAPDDAATFADMSSGPRMADGGGPLTAHATSTAVPITKPVCLAATGDGGRVNLYGCDSTYKVATSGAVWYLVDKFQASATMHDSAYFDPDELTGLKFGVSYGSGNQISTWSPTSVIDQGNCKVNTSEVDYKGAKVSSSTTECPETFGLYSNNATHFGTKWDGQGDGPSDGARATHGVDGVYNGASANPYPGVYYQYWYE